MSMKDDVMTATQPGCSPAPSARSEVKTRRIELRQLRIELSSGPLVLNFIEPMTADDVSDVEATLAVLIGSLKRRFVKLDEPRGLSAADEPGSEGVTPHPVAPNTQEEGT